MGRSGAVVGQLRGGCGAVMGHSGAVVGQLWGTVGRL